VLLSGPVPSCPTGPRETHGWEHPHFLSGCERPPPMAWVRRCHSSKLACGSRSSSLQSSFDRAYVSGACGSGISSGAQPKAANSRRRPSLTALPSSGSSCFVQPRIVWRLRATQILNTLDVILSVFPRSFLLNCSKYRAASAGPRFPVREVSRHTLSSSRQWANWL